MKRLCVFYKHAALYVGKRIDWIVCKQCRKALDKGILPLVLLVEGCPKKGNHRGK